MTPLAFAGPPDGGDLVAAVVVVAFMVWLLRRLLKVMLVVGILVLAVFLLFRAGPVARAPAPEDPAVPRTTEQRHNPNRYVADTSVFAKRPGNAACRGILDSTYFADPSVTLLVPTPAVLQEAKRDALTLVRLHNVPGRAWIVPVVESDLHGIELDKVVTQPPSGDKPPFDEFDARIVDTAKQLGLPLLVAGRSLRNQVQSHEERKRIWGDVEIVVACP
jgi:hypothetical protein